jgi:hypothetical protein
VSFAIPVLPQYTEHSHPLVGFGLRDERLRQTVRQTCGAVATNPAVMRDQRRVPRMLAMGLGAAGLLALVACGSSGPGSPGSAGHASAASTAPNTATATSGAMAGMDMSAGSAAPSATARLVCGGEIRGDIADNLGLTTLAPVTPTWHDSLYSCTYRTPYGPLTLSVKDSASDATGATYFAGLRVRLAPVDPIEGLPALGLPAFESATGDVAFLKDGRTLLVDATHLTPRSGPHAQSREAAAYAVAADVIGCWSE